MSIKQKLCKCGCGLYPLNDGDYIRGHKVLEEYLEREQIKKQNRKKSRRKLSIEKYKRNKRKELKERLGLCDCECGCGKLANPGRRFISGHYQKTEDFRIKISILNKGHVVSEFTRRRVSETHKGKIVSEETRRKVSEANKGGKRSRETRMRMSESHKGKYHSEETKRKMSEGKKGHEVTNETIRKIRKANKGRKRSKKTRRKMSIGQLKFHKENPGIYKGEGSPNWKGGISFDPYPSKFDNELRDAIRKRDGYVCQLCSKKQDGRKLCVHHIDYNKDNCNTENLIALCLPCHIEINSDREIWTRVFQNIMIKKQVQGIISVNKSMYYGR